MKDEFKNLSKKDLPVITFICDVDCPYLKVVQYNDVRGQEYCLVNRACDAPFPCAVGERKISDFEGVTKVTRMSDFLNELHYEKD